MDFLEKIGKFLEKLQNWPEQRKKFVLLTIVVVLAVVMGAVWIKNSADRLSGMGRVANSIKLPDFNLPEMPSLDILQTTTPTNGE